MEQRHDCTRTGGGLMSLVALSAALLVGGLTSALPKVAPADGDPSASRRVDVSLSMPQIAQSGTMTAGTAGTAGPSRPAGRRPADLGTLASVGNTTRHPAKLPPSPRGAAHEHGAGRGE